MRLTWTIALRSGPAVGSAEAATLDECTTQLELALKEALPDWTPEHTEALARVRSALAGGRRSVTATAFMVTLED
ncbi:hypothetical protein HUT19_37670 [Streptomyces sp. NA02950]|uniref:hypothetical protein n=1 Tax=Streptomyces sp. NA02950 TaxID=2742137 RepID=UPI001590FF29|nr:hypothetical protein [Streptomyces sp. NA02950]QKV96724.1 hypothetical protein HUT19_37670 [Streptomyces sp. NA02950]